MGGGRGQMKRGFPSHPSALAEALVDSKLWPGCPFHVRSLEVIIFFRLLFFLLRIFEGGGGGKEFGGALAWIPFSCLEYGSHFVLRLLLFYLLRVVEGDDRGKECGLVAWCCDEVDMCEIERETEVLG